MFTAALFTIDKIRKQPECSSTDEWIKNMYSIKKGILPFAMTWVDCYAKWKTEKDKYDIMYMWNLKKYNRLVNITKKKQTHRHREQINGYQWGGRGLGGTKY